MARVHPDVALVQGMVKDSLQALIDELHNETGVENQQYRKGKIEAFQKCLQLQLQAIERLETQRSK